MAGLESGKIMVNQQGDITVVYFMEQRMLDESNINAIAKDIDYLIQTEDRRQMLLNFQKVKYLSSAVLGKLVAFNKQIAALKGKLALCCIAPELIEVFKVTKLDKLLSIHPGEAEALAAFKKRGFFGG